MVHFGPLRDLARRELTECLDKYTGKKVRNTYTCNLVLINNYCRFNSLQSAHFILSRANRFPSF